MRIEMVCPGASSANCASDCTGDFTDIPSACKDIVLAFLQCVATEPLACVNGELSFPTCESLLIYVSYCIAGVSPPPTAGGTPVPQ
jgi:hypothetical protein